MSRKHQWTAEELKALIDSQSWIVQQDLVRLLLTDHNENSYAGKAIAGMIGAQLAQRAITEEKAGIGLGSIDNVDEKSIPLEGETLLRQAKRIGLPTATVEERKDSINVVKQMRHRYRVKRAEIAEKARAPGIVMNGWDVDEIIPPPPNQVTRKT
jgi:hypothetical protein